jgi:D-beta-D-heptose 7-phosphate kinase/D-beta-D-heptose 1-phosphate adenosyltransferase
MSWSDAVRWRKEQTGRVVFTNGVFDLLHVGHIDLLTAARALGDRLIVALNSDASVRRLKGAARPVRSEAERAYVVAALEAVDAVTVFEQDTPLEIVVALRPDVLVKGGDYSLDTIVGRTEVESWGGRVQVVPLTPGQSTTRIIEALRAGT